MTDNYRKDLIECRLQSRSRGLYKSETWACELLITFPPFSVSTDSCGSNDDAYELGRSVFNRQEYDRCAYFTKDSQTREGRFMHYYSRYLSAEKKRLQSMLKIWPPKTMSCNDEVIFLFKEMSLEMKTILKKEQLADSYLLYVHGMVLLKLDKIDEAIEAFVMSVRLEPLCWSSWQQLSQTVRSKARLNALYLPEHWFKKLFLATLYVQLGLNKPALNKDAIDIYRSLIEIFPGSSYIKTQVAIASQNLRYPTDTTILFESIRDSDPFRLYSWDVYSHSLFLARSHLELDSLARWADSIDPFRWETCICSGNYYSLLGRSEKAVTYFSRSTMLNPHHAHSWIVLGHEHMEMGNVSGALESYRSAIECNKRDYRAWYGLGQVYDILKMPNLSLDHYYTAYLLEPEDKNSSMAIGEMLEHLGRYQEVIEFYRRAGKIAYPKLANLYVRKGNIDKAAEVYIYFIEAIEKQENSTNKSSQLVRGLLELCPDRLKALTFLAEYFFKQKNYKLSYFCVLKCQFLDGDGRSRYTNWWLMKELSELDGQEMGISSVAELFQ